MKTPPVSCSVFGFVVFPDLPPWGCGCGGQTEWKQRSGQLCEGGYSDIEHHGVAEIEVLSGGKNYCGLYAREGLIFPRKSPSTLFRGKITFQDSVLQLSSPLHQGIPASDSQRWCEKPVRPGANFQYVANLKEYFAPREPSGLLKHYEG